MNSRRALLLASASVSFAMCLPLSASANPVGDSIKGVLLRARRQNGGAKLLAPFEASLQRLGQAREALTAAGAGGAYDLQALTDVLRTVRAASLNCYIFDALPGDDTETRASLITQQMQLADPCTFRLIVKNVVDFSPAEVQAQGYEMVESIIRMFSLLDGALVNVTQEGSSAEDIDAAKEQLDVTMQSVLVLRDFIKDVLQA